MSEETRARAIRPDGSFLVQAPAGSGKTELLTRRMLALLAHADAPEEILAITFTRKAAAEMRARVHRALTMPRPEANDPSLARWELAQAALARSRERGWRLERHVSRLSIMTLDALAAGLARRLPLLSGLGAPPAPLEDARPVYREAARAALEQALADAALAADAERLLLHQDNRLPRLMDLMAAMLARRETWLPLVARHARDLDGLRAAMEANLAVVMRERLAQADRLTPPAMKAALPELARFAAANLGREDAALAMPAGWPEADVARMPAWKVLASALLTGGGKLRSPRGLSVNAGFPRECKAEKERMKEMLALAEATPGLTEAFAAVAGLPDAAAYDDGQWRVIAALFRLLPLAHAELAIRFAARGEMDFTGIALAALDALTDDEGCPTDLLLRLDGRIRHVLVDEFQDTSELQVQLLRCLTAGWELGDGRTLFLVGDPMQSIYRFRKAEVSLFLKAADNAAELPPVSALGLERNFRSTPAIVEWVNRAFERIFPPVADVVHGAIPCAPALAARDDDEESGVHLHRWLGRDDAAEAERVVEIARAARAEGRRVGVLGRSRAHLREVVRALARAGLPYRAVDVLPLADAPEARWLRALARALLHPLDDDAWLAILRMPCCGLDTRDLWALLAGREGGVWQALNDEAQVERLAERERARFVREALAPCVAAAWRAPVAELVEAAWRRLGMPALVGERGRENAARVLEALGRVEEEGGVAGHAPFARLDAVLADLYAAPDPDPEAAGLEVLTMHGAKGLQWDTVILPGLGRRPRNGDAPLLAFTETVAEGDVRLLLAARPAAGGDDDAVFRMVRDIERAKEAQEDRRLFYVACTRAERALHLLGHVSEQRNGMFKADSGSFMALIEEGGEDAFGATVHEYAAREADGDAEALAPVTRVVEPPGAPPPPPSGPARQPEYAWAGLLAAPVGNAVHALLEWVGGMGVERWRDAMWPELEARARRLLLAEGLSGEGLREAEARVRQAMQTVLASERGRWVLSGRHEDAHCEWEILVREGSAVSRNVVDRAFVDQGVRWIVDYKTASHEGGDRRRFLDEEAGRHGPQLARYARALALLEPGREVRTALYFPLLDEWREVDVSSVEGA